jgi:hypothetical protein
MRHRSASRFTLFACLMWVLAGLLLSSSAGAAGIGARLLLVQKDGHSALFLPETHIGSPAQDDAYFRDVLRPAFAASSVLLAERSSASWFDHDYYQAACADNSQAEAALDPALADALRKHPPAVAPALRAFVPDHWTDSIGRFLRFQILFINLRVHGVPLPNGAVAPASTYQVRNAQSSILMTEAPRRFASVEDLGTFLHAYCALTPAQRAALIAETIRLSNEPNLAEPGKSVAQLRTATYQTLDTEYREALTNMHANLQRSGNAQGTATWTPIELLTNKYLLAERNQAWIAGLPVMMASERLPFYALGAAHFSDTPAGPGLITLLRNAGYSVTLIEDRRVLNVALSRLPALQEQPDSALAAQSLRGGCKRDGEAYGCDWSSPSVTYQVINPKPPQQPEIWSLCYHRKGLHGDQKQCVTSVRKVGTERDADLAAAARPLPEGWLPLSVPTLPGSFLREDTRDIAFLMQKGGRYGVVVMPDAASGLPASVVKTFGPGEVNPPQLSLIKPGSYRPACHSDGSGGDCAPLTLATEAIGLCFREASCEIIYYAGNAFHEIAITD